MTKEPLHYTDKLSINYDQFQKKFETLNQELKLTIYLSNPVTRNKVVQSLLLRANELQIEYFKKVQDIMDSKE